LLVVAEKAFEELDDKYKDRGSAKIKKGEFLFQDLYRKQNLNLRLPWNFIMRPSEHRYMSIKFQENGNKRTTCPHCPHCQAENAITEGQA
jgi:hypothetical protein